ncbi:hypothetical protein ASE85_17210 [Sphingobium sp. Leaf26]|uniref:sulfotransferase family protein n=1 Tax=Sphingobium sp. Leaf26 TaxID=1735693 RepID=UPI0006FBA1FD|nr:sulfotransferase [Sphingobium sp. Leaf26]KQN07970.1 hypothetical protein ASE85_17210 [Sphingobium sp. Leaf26]
MGKRIETFVVGVQKAGTTSLFALMREHPQLAAPGRKELHFFDDERRNWMVPDYADLASSFGDDGDRMRFEITPSYSYWPRAMERIHRYNPGARIILLFRNPFERAWSHWCMQYARGREDLPFARAIREEAARLDGLSADSAQRRYFSYVDRGRYATQLERLLTLFPHEQILLLTAEALGEDQSAVLATIARFLDIHPFPPLAPARENARVPFRYPALPDEDDRAFVAGLLRAEMQGLRDLTRSQIIYDLDRDRS